MPNDKLLAAAGYINGEELMMRIKAEAKAMGVTAFPIAAITEVIKASLERRRSDYCGICWAGMPKDDSCTQSNS